ncbi:MAG: helix-turn-helix domain-containing protein, partial [Thermoanaerobaculales bacterium]|nr:helix-turn-helix domain-containing protein [Thermoanaerobaculales bacterium]
MPWRETNPMEQRKEFINKFLTGEWTMAELTDRFGISRVTGYKWWDRFKQTGFDGLEELSRAPHSCPHRTPREIEEELVALRKRYPKWGPETLLELVQRKHPDWKLPANSTAGEILKRHGLVKPRKRRSR